MFVPGRGRRAGLVTRHTRAANPHCPNPRAAPHHTHTHMHTQTHTNAHTRTHTHIHTHTGDQQRHRECAAANGSGQAAAVVWPRRPHQPPHAQPPAAHLHGRARARQAAQPPQLLPGGGGGGGSGGGSAGSAAGAAWDGGEEVRCARWLSVQQRCSGYRTVLG